MGICYHPPDQNDFYERLDEILTASSFNIGQEIIIMWDLNTDMQNWTEVLQCDDVDMAWDRFKMNFF